MHDSPNVREIGRFASPGAEPMGLAVRGKSLWVACREAGAIYALDAATGAIETEVRTPGAPFGIAFHHDALYAVVGRGEDDDDRYLYRWTERGGFEGGVACSDLSGVHLASDGTTLFLTQAHARKLLALTADGAVAREVAFAFVPVGMTIVAGATFLIAADGDFGDLRFARLDALGEPRSAVPLAAFPFVARDLVFDGTCFWTAASDDGALVRFAPPADAQVAGT